MTCILRYLALLITVSFKSNDRETDYQFDRSLVERTLPSATQPALSDFFAPDNSPDRILIRLALLAAGTEATALVEMQIPGGNPEWR